MPSHPAPPALGGTRSPASHAPPHPPPECNPATTPSTHSYDLSAHNDSVVIRTFNAKAGARRSSAKPKRTKPLRYTALQMPRITSLSPVEACFFTHTFVHTCAGTLNLLEPCVGVAPTVEAATEAVYGAPAWTDSAQSRKVAPLMPLTLCSDLVLHRLLLQPAQPPRPLPACRGASRRRRHRHPSVHPNSANQRS